MSKSESAVQNLVREKASQLGMRVWRNNVGAYVDKRGVPIRYGLANESSQMNKAIKSSDLIGIRPVTITQDMVGKVIGQFVAIECKEEAWKFSENDERAKAQLNFINIVNNLGGYALFCNNEEVLC
jgi:hypothetical protein